MFSFTGSASVSTGSTVTCLSKKPVSATINAVNNFCVLAGARTSSAFFSYKICPVRASTIMTDFAPVAGIPPETRGGAISSRSSSGLALALACERGDRARVGFDGDSFGRGSGTPVGRTLSSSCAKTASGSPSAKNQAIQRRPRFIGGKFSGKLSRCASEWPRKLYKSPPR